MGGHSCEGGKPSSESGFSSPAILQV